jgi:hypothetical protein
MLVNCTTTFGKLCDGDLASKLVYFGANGVMAFQGLKIGVTIQLVEKDVLFSLASIAWHIGAIWQCKHFPTSHWLESLKPYYNPCMFIFPFS